MKVWSYNMTWKSKERFPAGLVIFLLASELLFAWSCSSGTGAANRVDLNRCHLLQFEPWEPLYSDTPVMLWYPLEFRMNPQLHRKLLLRLRDSVVANYPGVEDYGPEVRSITLGSDNLVIGSATNAEWDTATKLDEEPSNLCQDRPSCGDREGYRAPTFSCLGKALRKSGKLGPSRVMVSPNQRYVAVASYTGDEGCMKSGIWGPVEPWIDDYFVDIFDLKTGERIAGMKWSLRRNGASDYQHQWRWIGDRFFAFPMDEYHERYAFCAVPGENRAQ
jgi:hypothetical protein